MLFSKLALVPFIAALAGTTMALPRPSKVEARQAQATNPTPANIDPATALVNPDPLTAATPVAVNNAVVNNAAVNNAAAQAPAATVTVTVTDAAACAAATPAADAAAAAAAPATAAAAAAPATTTAANDKAARVKEFLSGGAGLLTKLIGL